MRSLHQIVYVDSNGMWAPSVLLAIGCLHGCVVLQVVDQFEMFESHCGEDTDAQHPDTGSEEEEEEEEEAGGDEQDVSVTGSHSTNSSSNNHVADELQVPQGSATRVPEAAASTLDYLHGDSGEGMEGSLCATDSETSSSLEELEDLSLDNKSRRPFRDSSGVQIQEQEREEEEEDTGGQSYLDPRNQAAVRQLVRATVSAQQKQQRKHSRAKRERKPPTKGGYRAKKSNRDTVRQALQSSSIW